MAVFRASDTAAGWITSFCSGSESAERAGALGTEEEGPTRGETGGVSGGCIVLRNCVSDAASFTDGGVTTGVPNSEFVTPVSAAWDVETAFLR